MHASGSLILNGNGVGGDEFAFASESSPEAVRLSPQVEDAIVVDWCSNGSVAVDEAKW